MPEVEEYLLGGGEPLARFAWKRLEPLQAYDGERGCDLVGTLAAYLRSGGNAAETARSLYVHINTLYYRLSRISDLTGLDLGDSDVRFELEVALRVLRLLKPATVGIAASPAHSGRA